MKAPKPKLITLKLTRSDAYTLATALLYREGHSTTLGLPMDERRDLDRLYKTIFSKLPPKPQ